MQTVYKKNMKMKHPKFEIFQSPKDNLYYFRLKAKNGRIILQSEGYTQKHNAEGGVEAIKAICGYLVWRNFFTVVANSNAPYYFIIESSNNKIIGVSETYTTKAGARKGIKSVQKSAPIASVVDLTLK
jgi:uncharacterized protein YegP (UPF0339 family)